MPAAEAFPSNFTRRTMSTSNIADFRGALFVISSTQTTCEMALIDSSSGFVAASCLKYKSSGNVDNSIDYRVAVTGLDGESSKVNSVTMVDAHPDYNPSTYANNIAILHWGDPDDINWHQYIAQDSPDWDNVFYSRRTMSSVSNAKWNNPAVISVTGTAAPSGCTAASNLYNSNQAWFLCMAQTTTSAANSNCQSPYGAAWAVYQPNNMAVAAIYSHSSIYSGDKLCGATGNQFHYYTLLQPYTSWASKMTGRKVYTYAADASYSYSGSSSFSMSNSGASGVSGVSTVSGDMYPTAKSYTGPGGTASNNGQTAGSSNSGGGSSQPSTSTGSNSSNNSNNSNNSTPTNDSNATTAAGDNNNDGGSDNNDNGNSNNDGGNSNSNSSAGGGSSNNSNGSSSSGSKESDKDGNSSNKDSDNSDGGDDAAAVTTNDKESSTDDAKSSSGDNSDGSDDGSSATDSDSAAGGAGKDGDSSNGSAVGGSNGGSGYGGLGRAATIAVATVVPVVTIIILIALFFLYRWWKRRQNARTWDPKNETANIDRLRIIDELEGTSMNFDPHDSTPPSYDDHGFQGNLGPDDKVSP
ncbi:hypothetical protein IWW51_002012 [Coemansia sp. RSA 2702]|nr:hypothetical protein IWW51_002012 [Coemansia sp. RSA 2702]